MAQKGRSKKRLKVVAWNLGIVLVVLFGMEGYIASCLNDAENTPAWMRRELSQYYQKYDLNIIQTNPACARYDSGLFYTLKPGNFTFTNREFSTAYEVNSVGLRDDEVSLDGPEIIVLGDSYTMGWGVEQQETYAQLLEAQTGKKVLNAGISSYGTAREFEMLKRLNTENLKTIIIQYCPNDIIENKNFVLSNHSLQVSSEETYQEKVEERASRASYYPLKHIINLPAFFFPDEPEPVIESDQMKALNSINANDAFLDVLRYSTPINPKVRIIIFSLQAWREDNSFIIDIEQRLNHDFTSPLYDQVSYLDLTQHLDSSCRFVLDPHLNAKGHRILAQQLKAHLEELEQTEYPEERVWMYENGDTSAVCQYQNGIKQGVFQTFWPNGQTSMLRTYYEGLPHGTEFQYDEQGNLATSKVWNYGQLVAGKED